MIASTGSCEAPARLKLPPRPQDRNFSPLLALMVTGLTAVARPAAAEVWRVDCWPLGVEYYFNTGSAVISFLIEDGPPIPVAVGQITFGGRNPDGTRYAHANFPSGDNLITVNIDTRELFASSNMRGGRVCVANTSIAPF